MSPRKAAVFNPENVGMGRRRIFDSRDEAFKIRSLLPKRTRTRNYKYWNNQGGWFDQLSSSSCVGHAFAHYLEDGPVTQHGKATALDPYHIYREAQKIDEWPGEEPIYGGTSVRAGAKIVQQAGYIGDYYWAWDVETVVDTLLFLGPVVIGTTWYEDMFYPDKKGVIRIGGGAAGGHAYKLDGVDLLDGMVRFKQSWGNGKIGPHFNNWGKNGIGRIPIKDLGLLIEDYGEVLIANEIKKVV